MSSPSYDEMYAQLSNTRLVGERPTADSHGLDANDHLRLHTWRTHLPETIKRWEERVKKQYDIEQQGKFTGNARSLVELLTLPSDTLLRNGQPEYLNPEVRNLYDSLKSSGEVPHQKATDLLKKYLQHSKYGGEAAREAMDKGINTIRPENEKSVDSIVQALKSTQDAWGPQFEAIHSGSGRDMYDRRHTARPNEVYQLIKNSSGPEDFRQLMGGRAERKKSESEEWQPRVQPQAQFSLPQFNATSNSNTQLSASNTGGATATGVPPGGVVNTGGGSFSGGSSGGGNVNTVGGWQDGWDGLSSLEKRNRMHQQFGSSYKGTLQNLNGVKMEPGVYLTQNGDVYYHGVAGAPAGSGGSGGGNVNISRYLQQAEQARQQAIASNEGRYGQLLQGYGQREQNVLNRQNQLRQAGQSAQADRINSILADYGSSRDAALDAQTQRGQQSIDTANAGNQDVTQAFSGRSNQLQQRQGGLEQAYQDRANTLAELHAQLGRQAARDIDERYDRQQGSTTNNAVERGLYNTTILDSLRRGVETDRSKEHRRLAEQLRESEIGLRTQLTGDALAARDRGTQLAERTTGDAVGSKERALDRGLGVLGALRREDADLRRSYEQPRLQFAAQAQGQQTALEEGLRTDDLRLMSQLPADTLGVIERRSDTYPSLTDIANLALQAGRSDGAMPVQSTGTRTGTGATSSPFDRVNAMFAQQQAVNNLPLQNYFNSGLAQLVAANNTQTARNYGFY